MRHVSQHNPPDGRGPGPYARSAVLAMIIYGNLGAFYLCIANAALGDASLDQQLLMAQGLVATTIFSVAGLMAAKGAGRTGITRGIVIAFACAFLTANGGGTFRDSLGYQPPFWVSAPLYVVIPVVVTALSTVMRPVRAPELIGAIRIIDNFSTGVFLYVGVAKVGAVLSVHDGPFSLFAVGVGVLTALGGGMIRDFLILKRVPTAFVSTAFVNAVGLAIVITLLMKWLAWMELGLPGYVWAGTGFAMLVLNEALAGRTFAVPH